MIHDPQTRSEIAQEWGAVRKLCTGSHRQYQVSGVFINETPPDSFYNLPFLLAYAVLDQVLAELIDQGTISCQKRRPLLGDKMAASQNAIPWQDYALVDRGRVARNELAHEAKLLTRTDCFAFIEAIENELSAWGVIWGK
jgi:hypothetical protein